MAKSRAERRHHFERKKARTRKILKRYGTPEWLSARRIGKFTKSHWGCQCETCMNPRKRNKGKKSDSLTHKELIKHQEIEDLLREE